MSCRTRNTETFTIALSDTFTSLDTLTTTGNDAAGERLRTLIFNSLVKKNENFDYVGDLASDIKTSDDGTTLTFTLRDNVKFHNGKVLSSADVKYTLDTLFASKGTKRASFFEKDAPSITSLETPDAKTVVLKVKTPALRGKILSSLVAIPIIPEGSAQTQIEQPVGSGAFKFLSFDRSQNNVELEANADYFDGAPNIKKLRVKTVTDANALQAELQSQKVDLVPLPSNLSSDTFGSLAKDPNLQVKQFNGSNIRYLGFNIENEPLNNVKVRQAIAYAINRQELIDNLLSGQAKPASSILPADSWAYAAGNPYGFDTAKAKQLLDEANFKDANGDGKREMPVIKFKIQGGSTAVGQYAQIIQKQLSDVGIPVDIDPIEANAMREQVSKGQFQMTTGIWVGGNQDPIFLRDLYSTGAIGGFNRSRYSNKELDGILDQAIAEPNRDKSKQLYAQAQEIISRDLPMLPLWYPANMAVANKRVENIKIDGSGDWSFVKNLTIK